MGPKAGNLENVVWPDQANEGRSDPQGESDRMTTPINQSVDNGEEEGRKEGKEGQEREERKREAA